MSTEAKAGAVDREDEAPGESGCAIKGCEDIRCEVVSCQKPVAELRGPGSVGHPIIMQSPSNVRVLLKLWEGRESHG